MPAAKKQAAKKMQEPEEQAAAAPDEVVGESSEDVVLTLEDFQGVESASDEELELALGVFQNTAFSTWSEKLVAGQFQRRIDFTLKTR